MRKAKEHRDNGIHDLRARLRRFAADRDWDRFHTPKNLAIALSVEASELLERFQWLTEEKCRRLDQEQLKSIREEMADVYLYLIRLADKLNVDLTQAAVQKIRLNAKKYPVSKARGSSRKHTKL